MTLMFCVSSSLKVIGTDTDRTATCDFLLVIHNNHGSISYHLQAKQEISVKRLGYVSLCFLQYFQHK